jgi:hypothetical protein
MVSIVWACLQAVLESLADSVEDLLNGMIELCMAKANATAQCCGE